MTITTYKLFKVMGGRLRFAEVSVGLARQYKEWVSAEKELLTAAQYGLLDAQIATRHDFGLVATDVQFNYADTTEQDVRVAATLAAYEFLNRPKPEIKIDPYNNSVYVDLSEELMEKIKLPTGCQRYVLRKDDAHGVLKKGDILICRPYQYDSDKLIVVKRESDGLDPMQNVYRYKVKEL